MVKDISNSHFCEIATKKTKHHNTILTEREFEVNYPNLADKKLFFSLKKGFRILTAWIFSNIGICIIVVAYLFFGAIMFKEIEGGKEAINDVALTRKETVFLMWNITEKYNLLHPKNWTNEIDKIIYRYQEKIVCAESIGFNGNDQSVELWDFSGSLLYSITVITTIGYGHIVPKTALGKMLTIFYAILGVPLFLLYLSNIGNVLATSFKWMYSHLCRCKFYRQKSINSRYRILTLPQHLHPNIIKITDENKTQDSLSMGDSLSVCSANNDYKYFNELDTNQVAVPIILSLSVMICYICGGALLFGEWEGWNFLDGFYFCFITLSTIGFGDILPGDAVDWNENEANIGGLVNTEFLLCSLYIILGMAVIAMCFNLMQEKVVRAVISLGKKIRLLKS